jgi:APA family basic amino acid/polyamine antiporter
VPRRRRQQGLERVLGTPALFATAYGNVGSSIYYALGVTAVFALGLTPLVFVVAGLIFACTAATYAEGTVRYPEAGGSASFARHGFNELVSFGAGWAQLLVYVVTVTTSAFFVPHYLSIFWEPMRGNPWDVVVGIVVILVLVSVNVIGVQEAAALNVVLAIVDFATQLLLVLLGFFLVFSPEILVDNVHWGVAPTWSNLALAVPVAMLAYTGVETVSNLAEEVRDPAKSVPDAYKLVAGAVFAIYFTLPLIALSAMPVVLRDGEYVTSLGLPPEEGGYANDPVLGLVKNLGLTGRVLDVLEIYVGLLAATILLIATNAGVIGASRITYSMSSYRQLPQVFRRLHPQFRTPWLAIVIFAGIAPIIVILPGSTTFIGTLYSFGATLSFTIAHAAIVRLRAKEPRAELAFRARPNVWWRGVPWPVFAIVGGIATGLSWLVIVVQNADIRWAGLGWLAVGLVFYFVYRRYVVHEPLASTVRAPALVVGPSLVAEYRTIVVPIVRSPESEDALIAAARLAADRGSTIVVLHVLELPLDRPLTADLGALEDRADELLDDAQALLEEYGVRVVSRLVRARSTPRAIVDEAVARHAELIVVGAPRAVRPGRRLLGRTAEKVLKLSPVRVLVTAGRRTAV